MTKKINAALISVYHKDGLAPIIEKLVEHNVTLISTGGTGKFIEELGFQYTPVEKLTNYPEIFGGRVKTLHPAIFGGILYRREMATDVAQAKSHQISSIDLVIVDLYPFEETVANGGSHEDIIEKIDIGGISLIRAAAKNYNDVVIVSNRNQYNGLLSMLENGCETKLKHREKYAAAAFKTSSAYDTAIYQYLNKDAVQTLRYGENPHQKGYFDGNLSAVFEQLHGKELSYNNLLDVDAAVALIKDFNENEGATFAILKHNNACGLATDKTVKGAYLKAFQADTLSAFGGILICNKTIDEATAQAMDSLFYESLIAPNFDEAALAIIQSKKNRMVLKLKDFDYPAMQKRSLLNGTLIQERDAFVDTKDNLQNVSQVKASAQEIEDALFALKLVKHTKSNAIILAKDGQLLSSGTGQTSRVDALQQAIAKAKHFKMDLKGATVASDAFFPFADCVEIAHEAGITNVVHPGGSKNDQLSIDYCDANGMTMLMNGHRHFKH